MKILLAALFVVTASSLAAEPGTFTGVIADEACAATGHAAMRMGPTDAECAKACVDSHAVPYVLQVDKTVYLLSDQRAAERFAGQKVTVVGTLDAAGKTIRVESVTAAK